MLLLLALLPPSGTESKACEDAAGNIWKYITW